MPPFPPRRRPRAIAQTVQRIQHAMQKILGVSLPIFLVCKVCLDGAINLCATIIHALQRTLKVALRLLRRGGQALGKFFREYPWVGGLIVIWIVLIVGYYGPILRGPEVFEAYLSVHKLSFTYTGGNTQSDRPLLETITPLQTLDIRGQQLPTDSNPSGVVELLGQFRSDDPNLSPALQNRLATLSTLQLHFPSPNSQLTATVLPTTPATANPLSLTHLTLAPNTRVRDLTYTPKATHPTLSLCLEDATHPTPNPNPSPPDPSAELDPDTTVADLGDRCNPLVPLQPLTTGRSLGQAAIQWGDQPLQLTLTEIGLPDLDQPDPDPFAAPLILTYTPNADAAALTLTSPTHLFLALIAPLTEPGPDLLPPYFGFDFDVERVALTQTIAPGRPNDMRQISSVLAGQVRLHAQTLDLTQGQFLIWDAPSPGITKLRSFQLETAPPTGIRILASGRGREISAGLYPNFPVETLRSRTWLARALSPEAFSALIGFLAAVTAFLVPITITGYKP